MRRMLLRTTCLMLMAAATTAAQTANGSHAKPTVGAHAFVGTWKLVSSVERLANGTERPYGFGPHATGYLMYDASGHVCAQVVNPDRPLWHDPDHPTPDEVKTAYDGFGGYCGTFTVDTEKHMLTHYPEVSFDPNAVGKPSPRNYAFDGKKLIYDGTDKAEDGSESHWTMIWQKVP